MSPSLSMELPSVLPSIYLMLPLGLFCTLVFVAPSVQSLNSSVSADFAARFQFDFRSTVYDFVESKAIAVFLSTRQMILNNQLDPECQSLMFTDSPCSFPRPIEIEPLTYWIEGSCGSEKTRIWVVLPSLRKDTNTTIYAFSGCRQVSVSSCPHSLYPEISTARMSWSQGSFVGLVVNDSGTGAMRSCPPGSQMVDNLGLGKFLRFGHAFGVQSVGDLETFCGSENEHGHSSTLVTGVESDAGISMETGGSVGRYSTSKTDHTHAVSVGLSEMASGLIVPPYVTVRLCRMMTGLRLDINFGVMFRKRDLVKARKDDYAFVPGGLFQNRYLLAIGSSSPEQVGWTGGFENHSHEYPATAESGIPLGEYVTATCSGTSCPRLPGFAKTNHVHEVSVVAGESTNFVTASTIVLASPKRSDVVIESDGIFVMVDGEPPPFGWKPLDTTTMLRVRNRFLLGDNQDSFENFHGPSSSTYESLIDHLHTVSAIAIQSTTNYDEALVTRTEPHAASPGHDHLISTSSTNVATSSTSLVYPFFDVALFEFDSVSLVGIEIVQTDSFAISDWTCNGVAYNDLSVCSTHGECISPSKPCQCDEHYTSVSNCSVYMCSGVSNLDPSVCSGHGTCTEFNNCMCDGSYVDPTGDVTEVLHCSVPLCWGVAGDLSFVCSSHGKCVEPERCECERWNETDLLNGNHDLTNPAKYGDRMCGSNVCWGHIASSLGNGSYDAGCSFHGVCVSPDECKCEDGWLEDSKPRACASEKSDLALIVTASVLSSNVSIGCILLIVIIVVAVLKVRHDRSVAASQKATLTMPLLFGDEGDSSLNQLEIDSTMTVIQPDDLEFLCHVAAGGSGSTVYVARWRSTEVIAKVFALSSGTTQTDLDKITAEAGLLASLSHPNVIGVYGICWRPPHLSIVMEYGVEGDLKEFLIVQKLAKNPSRSSHPTKIRWLKEISSGMDFLHNSPQGVIVHRDLKCENVLLGKDLTCKIADFGLSRLFRETDAISTTKGIGTSIYMAPEMTLGKDYTSALDVFAFGVTAWIICTEEFHPYATMMEGADQYQFIEWRVAGDPSFRPSLSLLPEGLVSRIPCLPRLLSECWDVDGTSRPTFEEILRRLSSSVGREEENCSQKSVNGEESGVVVFAEAESS